MARLMTVPEEIKERGFLTVTGNDFVSLPEIDAYGRILSVTVLHRGLGGLVELRGGLQGQTPFVAPYLRHRTESVPLDEHGGRPEAGDLLEWIPEFFWQKGRHPNLPVAIKARIIAPPAQKGFLYLLELDRPDEAGDAGVVGDRDAAGGVGGAASGEPMELEVGITVSWGYTGLRVFSSRPLDVSTECRFDPWTRSIVCEAATPAPLVALAVNASEDLTRHEFSVVKNPDNAPSTLTTLTAGIPVRLKPGEKATVGFFVVVQREQDGARTTSMHLRRLGCSGLQAEAERWLAERRRRAPAGEPEMALERVLNRNLLFNYFFATGKTLDTEELVTVTSRSPGYYVSAAFWSRDALLWSFPGLLVIDPARAREALLYAFRAGARNVGEHAQYLDGTSLYPGFELDEAAAYLVALGKYLDETGDWTVTADREVLEGMDRVLAAVERWKRPVAPVGVNGPNALSGLFLVATFLDPSDDPVTKPFLTYDNVLLWHAWLVAARVFEKLGRPERAARLRRDAAVLEAAIKAQCVVPGPFGPMFAWAVDGKGGYELYDNPPGSLQLLGYYGFPAAGEVLMNTNRWIWSGENRFLRTGKFGAPSSAHTPHPWPMAVANRLLAETSGASARVASEASGQASARAQAVSEAVRFLTEAAMDNGLACESVDVATGVVKTGAAFATAAGMIAYALWRGQIYQSRN